MDRERPKREGGRGKEINEMAVVNDEGEKRVLIADYIKNDDCTIFLVN